MIKHDKVITDSLGFPLVVSIDIVENLRVRGRHTTYSDENGNALVEAAHAIEIRYGLPKEEVAEVVSHEAYHLFYSVRHLITCDEETEAEVFGHLVRRIHKMLEE